MGIGIMGGKGFSSLQAGRDLELTLLYLILWGLLELNL